MKYRRPRGLIASVFGLAELKIKLKLKYKRAIGPENATALEGQIPP